MTTPLPPSPDEALRRARAALEAGDVRAARRLAEGVLAAGAREAIADEARALLKRTGVPWDLLGYGALAAVCFLVLVIIAIARSGHP
jgi:hypothetical protein